MLTVELDRDVRLQVYRALIETGAAPTTHALAAAVGTDDVEVVEASLKRLQDNHALVLAPGTVNVWMAHPFSTVRTPYAVTCGGRRYWANCAWDYFAIPPLVGANDMQTSRCAQTGDLLHASYQAGTLVDAEGVVHFVVPPRQFWDNIAFT